MATGDLRDRLEAGLGAAYTIEREIGRGGMATVFLAHDRKHDRPVALKVLHAHLAATLGPERFRREIALAARLQHPHILAVHDSGETPDGLLWFTMPYVEGETLRARLTRQQQLPLEDALRITCEVAGALEYAHSHGVVHRDIKPENILLSSAHALVADFGIATVLTQDTAPGLTTPGVVIGTPAYMSPEQASANRTLDGRTDIYSLATVLYEMLAGAPPPPSYVRAGSGPTSVRRSRASVPESVDAALQKALAPLPADRFASAADFATALTGGTTGRYSGTTVAADRRPQVTIAVTVALLAIVALLVTLAVRRPFRDGTTSVLAVLPFDNLGAGDDEYFAEGLTDELRGKLSSIGGLRVIATGSSEQYRHTTKSLQQIGGELGAQYLLVGRVRWQKRANGRSRVRVSPELVEVLHRGAPTTTWTRGFDADLEDVFTVQADIATQVASELGVALGRGVRQAITKPPTDNLAAYDAYLQGLALLPRTITAGTATPSAGIARQAAAAFRQAVTLDPTFAVAWARLSLVDSRLSLVDQSPAVLDESRAAAERALTLSPALPEGHSALGAYYANGPGDYTRALSEDSIALSAAPDNAELLSAAAANEINLGRIDAAIDRLNRALALDPRSVVTAARLATALLRRGDFTAARVAADRGLVVDPTSLVLLEAKAATIRAGGDLAGARAVLDRALAVEPSNLELIEQKAMTYLMAGDLGGARRVLHDAQAHVDARALTAYVAGVFDLYWVLDSADQRVLLGLPAETFIAAGAGNRRDWALSLAHVHWMRGERVRARAYADAARRAAGEPASAQDHAILGVADAYLGDTAGARRAAHRALSLDPIDRDRQFGPYTEMQVARIFMLVGEPDSASAALAAASRVRGFYLTPAWLAIDPTWASLRPLGSSQHNGR